MPMPMLMPPVGEPLAQLTQPGLGRIGGHLLARHRGDRVVHRYLGPVPADAEVRPVGPSDDGGAEGRGQPDFPSASPVVTGSR
jgi:hypothetical protein